MRLQTIPQLDCDSEVSLCGSGSAAQPPMPPPLSPPPMPPPLSPPLMPTPLSPPLMPPPLSPPLMPTSLSPPPPPDDQCAVSVRPKSLQLQLSKMSKLSKKITCVRCQSPTPDNGFKYRFKDVVEYCNIMCETTS